MYVYKTMKPIKKRVFYELVCYLPCGGKALYLEACKNRNDTDSYTRENLIGIEGAYVAFQLLKPTEMEWEMENDYKSCVGPITILYWLPDRSQAFGYIPYRNPVHNDSYVWVLQERLSPKRRYQRWKPSQDVVVEVRCYDESEKWMWKRATILSKQADMHGFHKVLMEGEMKSQKIHPSCFRNVH